MDKGIRSYAIEAAGSPPGPIKEYFLSPEEIAKLPSAKPIPKHAKKPLPRSSAKNRRNSAISSSKKK